MPAIVTCPKCKKRYQLPDTMLGKPVKCQSCGTSFQTKSTAAAGAGSASVRTGNSSASTSAGRPQATAGDLSQFGIDGPLRRQQNDVFAGAAPMTRQSLEMLGNHAANPGFGELETENKLEAKVDKEESRVEEAEFLQNPALRSESVKRKSDSVGGKKKKKKKEAGPFHQQAWFMVVVGLPALLGLVLVVTMISATAGGYGLAGFYWLTIIVGGLIGFWNIVECNESTDSFAERFMFRAIPGYAFYIWSKYWSEIWRSAMAMIAFWIAVAICLVMIVVFVFSVEHLPPVPGFGWTQFGDDEEEVESDDEARIPIVSDEVLVAVASSSLRVSSATV